MGFADKRIFCRCIGPGGEVFVAIAGDKAYETASPPSREDKGGIQDTRFEINDQDRRSVGEISGEADTVLEESCQACIDSDWLPGNILPCPQIKSALGAFQVRT